MTYNIDTYIYNGHQIVFMPIEGYQPFPKKYPHLIYYRVRAVDPRTGKKRYIKYLGASGHSLSESKMIDVSIAIDSIEDERKRRLTKLEKEIVIYGYKHGSTIWTSDKYTPDQKLDKDMRFGGEFDFSSLIAADHMTIEDIKDFLSMKEIYVSNEVIKKSIDQREYLSYADERKEKSIAKRNESIARRNELIEKGKLTESEIQGKIKARLRTSDELIEELRDAREELRRLLEKSDVEKKTAMSEAKEYKKKYRNVTKLTR